MSHGGARVGAGRPRKVVAGQVKEAKPAEVKKAASKADVTPLEYMLAVINDEGADKNRRDRMAVAAAPYVHGKPADAAVGKKEQRQTAADEAAVGKFAVPAAPKLVINNRR